ncbi:hypothetical protein RP20_CCG024152 [Aedes albopictus]|nr:hypothetical protein RP20_CCG024152 [Aedes albopictus]
MPWSAVQSRARGDLVELERPKNKSLTAAEDGGICREKSTTIGTRSVQQHLGRKNYAADKRDTADKGATMKFWYRPAGWRCSTPASKHGPILDRPGIEPVTLSMVMLNTRAFTASAIWAGRGL